MAPALAPAVRSSSYFVAPLGLLGNHGIQATESALAMDDKDLYGGLIRLHVLHHAALEPIFGLGMIEELSRHGYRLSAGTLYPILHGLEAKGYLRSSRTLVDARIRRVYRATPKGREALLSAKERVRELFGELLEPHRGTRGRK